MLVTIGLVAIIGMAALAIDLGVLFTARSEAQRAAEAGAHAGATVLTYASNDEAGARRMAVTFAEANPVRGVDVEVLDEDVDVDLANQLVRVRVQRSTARANPVATFFARIFGMNTADIGAAAAAQSWPGLGINCPLPLVMPDRWSTTPAPSYTWPTASDTFDPINDVYHPWMSSPPAGYQPTGYGTPDRGQRILITMSSPSDSPQPGWYYSIRLPGAAGGADFRSAIAGCWDPDAIYEKGMEVIKEPGNMVGPTLQGFRDLINQDPDAMWNPGAVAGGCVTNRGDNDCRGSPR
jgi:hypothetical protein